MISSGQLVLKGTIVNGHELKQTLGDGDGQGGLACYSPWSFKESDTTEQLKLLILAEERQEEGKSLDSRYYKE